MRKLLTTLLIALASLLALWFAYVPAHAGSMMLLGVGRPTAAAASYTGPGDVSVNGATDNWFAWGSCARVYKTSLANTSTSLCDLVAVTGGAAVCTLRGSSTGFVDLAASYCAGTTPSAACAAASGGSCKVTKVYDQTGNTHDWTQATLANMPALTFSGLSGLPVMTCAGTCSIRTGTFTQAGPLTLSAVYIRTTVSSTGGIVGANNIAVGLIGSSTTGQSCVEGNSTPLCAAASENAWHALQGLINTSGAINVDGTDTTGAPGSTGITAGTLNFFSVNAVQLAGSMAEEGMLAVTSSATDRNNIRANQKTAYPALP